MPIDKYIKDGIEYKKIYCDNTIREVKDSTTLMNKTYFNYWPSRYDPILPGTNRLLKSIIFKQNIELNTGVIYWTINADNSEKTKGQINVVDINKYERRETESISNEEDEEIL